MNPEQELQDEAGAALGDPRRCPRHTHVKISSPDGLHDAPCGECEWEIDGKDRDNEAASPTHAWHTDEEGSICGNWACPNLSLPGSDFCAECS